VFSPPPPPSIITYQGKIISNNLAVTTTLNIKLSLYDASSGGTVLYTASGTVGVPAALSVTPSAGLFSVDLGGSGTNTLNPNIFQNNASVYLEVTVGAEVLSPRKQITASPYSFNSLYLNGVAATSTASTSTYIPISDSSGNFNFNGVTSTKLNVSGTSTLATTTVSGYLGINTTTPTQALDVVGNIQNLAKQGYISTISTTTVGSRPYAVAVAGRYAYVVNYDNPLAIFDISIPTAPVQVGTVTVGNGPISVAVNGRYAYTANINGNTVSVVDVSNPNAPVQIATVAVGAAPSSIAISGRYAYTANYTANNISVIDISNPSAPSVVATLSMAGSGATNLVVSGRYAYVANFDNNTMSVLDISTPSTPVQMATTSVGTHPN